MRRHLLADHAGQRDLDGFADVLRSDRSDVICRAAAAATESHELHEPEPGGDHNVAGLVYRRDRVEPDLVLWLGEDLDPASLRDPLGNAGWSGPLRFE